MFIIKLKEKMQITPTYNLHLQAIEFEIFQEIKPTKLKKHILIKKTFLIAS